MRTIILKTLYSLVIAVHIFYGLIILSVLPITWAGKIWNYHEKVLIFSLIAIGLAQAWVLKGGCILTLFQRKIEQKINPLKRPTERFIQEMVLPWLRLNLSQRFIHRASIAVVVLDIFTILFLA